MTAIFLAILSAILMIQQYCQQYPSRSYMYYFLCSKQRPSGPMLSISRNVRMFVCLFLWLSVRHTFSLRLTVFLPPLLKVQYPNFLNIQNPWGNVMKKWSQILKLLLIKAVKLLLQKKVFTDFFLLLFVYSV